MLLLFFRSVERRSVTYHLSIIIYHNITPSASYDAIIVQRFATLFFET